MDRQAKRRNYLLKLAYDGRRYHGWQIQNNALTVQQVFQEALGRVIGEAIEIKACSRTDTGVHAREFCLSFKTSAMIPPERMPFALNRFLPDDIAVLDCRIAPQDFHARYSCKGKEYSYEIWNAPMRNPFLSGYVLHYWYPIDVDLLHSAAGYFIGKHDFSAFCTTDQRQRIDMERTVTKAEVFKDGNLVIFRVAADGFLYNMVRIMVGTLLRVQERKIKPNELPKILLSRDRKQAGPTAPAEGLFLNRVFYSDD